MGDVVGRLFHEFAITLAVTIVISAVVSLTLVPMMCAKLLRHRPEAEETRHRALGEREVPGADRPLRRGARMGARAPAAHAAGRDRHARRSPILLYVFIPKGFFPVQDTGVIQAITEAPQSVSFADMAAAPGEARGGDPEGQGRREPVLVHRRRRHEHHPQQRPHAHQPEARRRPLGYGERHHPPPAARDGRRHRHLALHAAGAGSVDRRHRQPHAVPVRARGCQSRPSSNIWVPQARRRAAAAAADRGCRERPGERGPVRLSDHRPRHRRPLRHHARRPSTTRCTTPSASASSRPSSRSRTSTA